METSSFINGQSYLAGKHGFGLKGKGGGYKGKGGGGGCGGGYD